jgi:hypothetical protein
VKINLLLEEPLSNRKGGKGSFPFPKFLFNNDILSNMLVQALLVVLFTLNNNAVAYINQLKIRNTQTSRYMYQEPKNDRLMVNSDVLKATGSALSSLLFFSTAAYAKGRNCL